MSGDGGKGNAEVIPRDHEIEWSEYQRLFAQFDWRDKLPATIAELEERQDNPLYQLVQVIHEQTNDTPSDIRSAEDLKDCAAKDKDFWEKDQIKFGKHKYANGKEYVEAQLRPSSCC